MCELVEARRRQQAEFAREETLLSAKRKELEALRAEVDRLEESVARLRAREAALGDKPTEQTAATPQ
jgi:polyhydroxyalkanoate synthesis regulator phasin